MKRTRNFQLLKYLVGKRNVIDVLTKFLKTQDLGDLELYLHKKHIS